MCYICISGFPNTCHPDNIAGKRCALAAVLPETLGRSIRNAVDTTTAPRSAMAIPSTNLLIWEQESFMLSFGSVVCTFPTALPR